MQNWYKNKTKALNIKGLKVISSSEEEVLGNLMICVFEKADNVSTAMICHLLLRILLICLTRMHKITTGQSECCTDCKDKFECGILFCNTVSYSSRGSETK